MVFIGLPYSFSLFNRRLCYMIEMSRTTALEQWHDRFSGQRRRVQVQPFAAMGYLSDEPIESDLIEVGKLTLVILYGHEFRPGHTA
jgi:hypothetical protein